MDTAQAEKLYESLDDEQRPEIDARIDNMVCAQIARALVEGRLAQLYDAIRNHPSATVEPPDGA